jgi:hypothetical protein
MFEILFQHARDAAIRTISLILTVAILAALAAVTPIAIKLFGLWLAAGVSTLALVWALLSPSKQ